MLQPSPSSIHFVNPHDLAKNGHLSGQILGSESWMIDSNSDKNSVSMNMENNHIDMLTSFTYQADNSQLSTLSYESKNSALKFVYQRKKPQKQYTIGSAGQASINLEGCEPLFLGGENQSDAISENDFCISFLRNHGLLGNGHIRTSGFGDSTIGTCSSRACKTCARSDNTVNLLICDDCDSAFHAWCCRPRVNDIPTEEWFCNLCVKKKQKMLKEMKLRKLQNIAEGEAGNNLIDASNVVLTCLDMMLLDTEPHKSDVRVGKGFQAFVPEWSGPNSSDSHLVGEALEIGQLESERLHNPSLNNQAKGIPISNWLQCQEVTRGIRKDFDGTVCGKWRRAPLCETQSDDWDCFSAVLWDPAHADCAAPQELETEEVLKQLKYIQMLKPTLTGKRPKISHPRRKELQGPSKRARNL